MSTITKIVLAVEIAERSMANAGFEDRGGRGSHRNFVHPKVAKPVTISGKAGDDAKRYQERAVSKAIEGSKS
jgi:predicted RNA binding protein YcfA (HicA-like mRNA interferase family)